eukprot:COSAG05_NODE_16786_length_339_cov_0.570833_1_plen_96_part_01
MVAVSLKNATVRGFAPPVDSRSSAAAFAWRRRQRGGGGGGGGGGDASDAGSETAALMSPPPLLGGATVPASNRVFKQKTAYEILRSDWSSDVCSSD